MRVNKFAVTQKYLFDKCQTWNWNILSIVSLLASFAVLILYIARPITDIHGFRQTQTALTAFWLPEHWQFFRYQTPVLGYPWSIPFEFPLYQILVSFVWKVGIPLDAAGRIVSWLAMAGTLYPISKICKKLFGDNCCFTYCAPLYILSPIMIFWGRTFMIETFCIFLLAMFLWYAIVAIDTGSFASFLAAGLFGALGTLVKLTTAPPFFAAAGVYALVRLRDRGLLRSWRCVCSFGVLVVCTLGLTWWWVSFSDHVKMQNIFGQILASDSLAAWNFGSVAQRLDGRNWDILLQRINTNIIGGNIWLYVLPAVFVLGPRHYRHVALTALSLFLLPIVIFFNLHKVHDYYQVACSLFLLVSMGVVYAGLDKSGHCIWARFLFLFQIACMLFMFMTGEYVQAMRSPGMRPVGVGNFINNHTETKSAIIVFGCDWSSEVPYYAQRKSITVASWMLNKRPEVANNLVQYVGDLPVSAIVTCPEADNENLWWPAAEQAIAQISHPKEVVIEGCTITFQDMETR